MDQSYITNSPHEANGRDHIREHFLDQTDKDIVLELNRGLYNHDIDHIIVMLCRYMWPHNPRASAEQANQIPIKPVSNH